MRKDAQTLAAAPGARGAGARAGADPMRDGAQTTSIHNQRQRNYNLGSTHTHYFKTPRVLPLKSNTHPAWRAAPAVAGPARAGRRAYAVLTPVSDIEGLPYLLHHGELLRLRDASEMDSTANLGSRRVYLGVR